MNLEKFIEELEEVRRSGLPLHKCNPHHNWIVEHKLIPGHKYLPIEITEALLDEVFPNWEMPYLTFYNEKNSVACVVRLLCNGRVMHGTGAIDIDKETPSMVAYPIAKSLAIKDAAHEYGNIFGRNLNRIDEDTIQDKPKDKKERPEPLTAVAIAKEKSRQNIINQLSNPRLFSKVTQALIDEYNIQEEYDAHKRIHEAHIKPKKIRAKSK